MQLGDARQGKLGENITGFSRALRRAGLPLDSSKISLAIEATLLIGVERKDDLAAALRACLVSRPEDLVVFDQMFAAFFKDPELTRQLLSQLLPKAPTAAKGLPLKSRVQEALAAKNKQNDPFKAKEDELQLDAAMTASDQVRLQQADFQSLSASEFQLVERLARKIALPLPRIQGRRTRSGRLGERIHGAQTLRMAAKYDGELWTLPRLQRQKQDLPLLILVDISGSMERYARLLLAFLHQSTRNHPRQVFAFGTGLTDLNLPFKQRDPDDMLAQANARIKDFAGGTQLGQSLAELRIHHAKKLTGKRTIVLLISDGLDTGSAPKLDSEIGWLKRHSRKVLWLNPLLRFDAYAPLASGAAVLSQHVDGMLAIHNLSRLEELASAMTKLLQKN
jgi:uncharacterized protein with von Willebrand factor type A (vWA) domain